MWVCARGRAGVCANGCVRTRVRACVGLHESLLACVSDVFAIFDNDNDNN